MNPYKSKPHHQAEQYLWIDFQKNPCARFVAQGRQLFVGFYCLLK